MYYKTDRQKCTYDKIPKIRLHLWKGNSYNNYIMTRIESVILCFLWWELRTEENSLFYADGHLRSVRKVWAVQVLMTYTVLSLFFIPCFKWNRHYYVQMSCCNTLYELDPEIGKAIARGDQVEILPQHLTLVNRGSCGHGYRRCNHCVYETAEDFEFCPEVRQPVLVWWADERGCWFYEKR